MSTQQELQAMVREILGDDFLSLRIWNYHLSEDVESQQAHILASLQISNEVEITKVDGTGVGMIDALFKGLKGALAGTYPSLEHIYFVTFGISGDFSGPRVTQARTDAIGHVELGVENEAGRRFVFRNATASVTGSSVATVVAAVEHFVNAERAVLRVLDWVADAKRRSRAGLVERYTIKLADLLQNASYSDVIQKRRGELGL